MKFKKIEAAELPCTTSAMRPFGCMELWAGNEKAHRSLDLAALNDEFTLKGQEKGEPLRLTTVVTGTFDGTTGEFNFAYAAHPRMLVWRARDRVFYELGEGLENLPLGFITGEQYNEQSIRLNVGDMILAFSDGATEARSPAGEQLTHGGLVALAEETLRGWREQASLAEFS